MNVPVPAPEIPALRETLKAVYDPEFGVSVDDLGLIYDLRLEADVVFVTMTLTSMYCPAGDVIMNGVRAALEAVPGVSRAEVALVWEPTWSPEMLSPEARRTLGWDTPRVEE